MDKCPPEICTKIFSEACLDSGYTGRSLSLVSKFIHNTSRSVKLQSICLRSLEQTVAFASLLKETPPHLRRVRYLFISSPEPHKSHPVQVPLALPQPLAEGNGTQLVTTPSTPQQKKASSMIAMERHIRRRAAREKHKQGMIVATRSILADVRESLEVLETAISYLTVSPTADAACPISLPHLTELTMQDAGLMNWMNEPAFLVPCQRLRRLHIIGDIRMGSPFTCVGKLAPLLTHLRISGVQNPRWFGSSLERALGIGEGMEILAQNRPLYGRLPLSVQQVLVKLANPPEDGGHPGMPWASYDAVSGVLLYLNETEDRVILLKAEEHLECICEEDDWLDRVAGGEGCWSLRDRVPTMGILARSDRPGGGGE